MTDRSFQALEHAGWVEKANNYDDVFAKITNQAIDPTLNSLGELSGKRLLDVACGTGHIAGHAAARSIVSEGIDFASTMVAKANLNYPRVPFHEGNAEALPYGDAQFDAVACGFGLLHLEHPETAIREALRVLKQGGRYAFTTWCSPEQGSQFFELVMGAIKEHGTFNVPLPPAPPIFRFAAQTECTKALTEAGFAPPRFDVLPLTWHAGKPQDVLDLIYKSVVRTPMLINAQTDAARELIHQAILVGSERYRKGNALTFSFPALLVTAVK